MIIQSERLICQLGRPDEFDLYYLLAGNPEVMHHITGDIIPRKKAKKRFSEVMEKKATNPEIGYYWVRDRKSNVFMGLVKLEFVEPGVVELGYSLLPEFWGKGYTSEIVGQVIGYTRSLPHLQKLIAIIDPENGASKAILDKFDFEFFEEGLFNGMPAEYYQLRLR